MKNKPIDELLPLLELDGWKVLYRYRARSADKLVVLNKGAMTVLVLANSSKSTTIWQPVNTMEF